MATSVRVKPESKLRKDKQENLSIVAASYLRNFEILILFSNNRMKVVNFKPALKKYAKGHFAEYLKKKKFMSFNIEQGNIVWGNDWDIVFPVSDIYSGIF